VFLYHAITAGLNMGIINAGALPIYEDIDIVKRRHFEEVIFNNSEDGNHVSRLIDLAELEKSKARTGAPE